MTVALVGAFVLLLGYALWRTVGWCVLEPPMADRWRKLLASPDEPAMPPRRTRQRI